MSMADLDKPALLVEMARLNKIIQALMNRAERSTSLHSSDFNRFQTALMLEELVQQRTQALEAALHENEKITRALREAEQKYHSVLDQSLVGITMTIENRFHYANPKFADIMGYSLEEIQQLTPIDIRPESDRAFFQEVVNDSLVSRPPSMTFTTHALRKDGQIITVEISGSPPINIGGKPALIEVWADISERLRIEAEVQALQNQLLNQAIHDPLTGLYNRLFLNESIERELALAERQGYPISVVMSDLDHFKQINDSYGHLAGDEVLQHFSGIMVRHSRSSDFNCRYGGEEFFLLMPNTTEQTACERAELLCHSLAERPVRVNGLDILMTASFGVATFPADGITPCALIAAADKALYAAKDAGRNQVISHSTLKHS